MLHYQGLPYILEIIRIELISRHHDNPLVGHFGIKKTCKLVAWKYYWPTLCHDINNYVKGCNLLLALKIIQHKQYGDLLMDFVTDLPISTDWKRDSYDSILVIVDWLIKIVNYKLVKLTINAPVFVKVIIDVIVRHHGLPDSIVTDWKLLFISKFWSLLCYFLGIKRRLSTIFHLSTDGQTKRQNSTMEAYLQAFVHFKQNN